MPRNHKSYDDVLTLYNKKKRSHPAVIHDMKKLIDDYVESRDEFTSKQTGRMLLPKHEQFRNLFGDESAPVFGILLKEHLTSIGWKLSETRKGLKVYRRH